MLSITLLIICAAMFLCAGFLIGDIYTLIFAIVSAIISTVALIIAIKKRKDKDNG